MAASLGSDIPFFLQDKPALATGRGEKIQPLDFFPALQGAAFLLIHPGFGIATAWAYQQLARFPAALNGRSGRAQRLISLLQARDLGAAGAEFYNSLEAPALEKYPAAGAVPGIPPCQRRGGHADVRQRVHYLCRGGEEGGGRGIGGEVQSEIRADELGGGGGGVSCWR